MPSYMHVGNPNNIANKIKSFYVGNSDNVAVVAKSIFMGNSDGKATGAYQRIYTSTSTWYTSSIVPADMYDTTALTCSSTSGESYLTRASKSGTSYLTKGTRTRNDFISSVYMWETYHGKYTTTYTSWYTEVLSITNITVANNFTNGYLYMTVSNRTLKGQMYSYTYCYGNIISSSSSYTGKPSNNTYYKTGTADNYYFRRSTWNTYASDPLTLSTYIQFFSNNIQSSVNLNSNYLSTYSTHYDTNTYRENNYRTTTRRFSVIVEAITSGTSYLTRSSTSATSYLTRSSTSAYTGKSSTTYTSE